jgi:hypothetical protein
MADVFSDLVAQSLGSVPVIQPLIPPLFAPAPTFVADTAPFASKDSATMPETNVFPTVSFTSNDTPTVMPETALWETEPTAFAATEIPHTSELLETPGPSERRTVLPDLVPPDVLHQNVPSLSLRRLIQPQQAVQDWSEQAPAVEVQSTEAPLSRSVIPAPQTLGQGEEQAVTAPVDSLPQTPDRSTQLAAGAATLSGAFRQDQANQGKGDIETASLHRVIAAEKQVAPVQPVIPEPEPLPESFMQTAQSVQRDDGAGQHVSSLPQPQMQRQSSGISTQVTVEVRDIQQTNAAIQPARSFQETPIRPLLDTLPSLAQSRPETLPIAHLRSGAASPAVVPVIPALTELVAGQSMAISVPGEVAHISTAGKSAGASERAVNTLMLDEMGEIVEEAGMEKLRYEGNEGEAIARGETVSHVQRNPLDARPGALGQEAVVAKEDEAPLIRVEIGRVVVRGSTPVPQHNQASLQKRALRPAQSLDEYLKQRERRGR